MATRSLIFVQVDKDDIGREIIFNHKKLPNGMASYKRYKVPTTTILKEYIGVYCHYDGYPENVGMALAQYYTNKEDILNLVSGGFIRSLHIDNETLQILGEFKRCGVDYFRQRGDIFEAPINMDMLHVCQLPKYITIYSKMESGIFVNVPGITKSLNGKNYCHISKEIN